MSDKAIIKNALREACEALMAQVGKNQIDIECITALSNAVRALAAAADSTDFDDAYINQIRS